MNYLLNSLLIASLASTLCIGDTFSQNILRTQVLKKQKQALPLHLVIY